MYGARYGIGAPGVVSGVNGPSGTDPLSLDMRRDLTRRRGCTCRRARRGLAGLGELVRDIDAERYESLDRILEQLSQDRSGELDRELALRPPDR